MSVIRGEKYMVDAYLPTRHTAAGARDSDGGDNRDREIAVRVPSAVVPEPCTAGSAAPVAGHTKER